MRKVFCIAAVALAMAVQTFADPVSIFGKIQDTLTGLPLDSVIVKLAGQAIADTTGANSVFLLTGETAGILRSLASGTGPQIRCSGANVNFSVSQPTHVSIEAFNTLGRLLGKPFDQLVKPGAYRVPVGHRFAAQIIYLRVTCGSNVRIFRMQGAMPRGGVQMNYADRGSSQAPLFKVAAAATVDKLVFSRSGYAAKTISINSYTPADSIFVALKPMPLPRIMRKITGGTFSMGIAGTADTVHSVTVSSFYIDTTEVTQADFLTVMGRNPSIHSNNLKKPVENVTWFDAVLFCNMLSKREGFDTAYTFTSRRDTTTGACVDLGDIAVDIKKKAYRMPTEAEWEFACRGGSTTTFFWGIDSTVDTISKYAWYLGNVTTNDSTTQPVATKNPNTYGLYDMSGNVWEWCTDQWADYGSLAQTDPCVLTTPAGTLNLKGGDFIDPPSKIASGLHQGARAPATLKLPFFGFRVVLPPVYTDSAYSYMTLVGASILAAKDTAINKWYDEVHIPLLMGFDGLKEAIRYKKANADTTLPAYWATYHFATKGGIDSMRTSAAFDTAIKNMLAVWPPANGEFTTNLAINYQKIIGWERPGITGIPQRMTIVGYEFATASDAAVNTWYNNIHVPLLMRYKGLAKAVRYKKMGDTTDINLAGMPTYLAIYYYATQPDQAGMNPSPEFAAANQNMIETWKNNEMTMKCAFPSANIFSKKR